MLKVLGYYDICTGEGERWPTVCVSRGQILQNLNFKEVVTPQETSLAKVTVLSVQ